MRVYFTPEFSRTIEGQASRVQNITKLISKFIEDHSWDDLIKHPKFQAKPTNEPDLYVLHFDELRYFVSLHRDDKGEYAIMVSLDLRGAQRSFYKLSDRNLPYDYVQARGHIINAIQKIAQEPGRGLRLSKFSAQAAPGVNLNDWDGQTAETGPVTITYVLRRDRDGKELPEITCKIDHGSDWSPDLDVRCQGKGLLLGVYPAWDWTKLVESFRSEIMRFHQKLAAETA
jgi:hypothetical protein